jgi:hypothetical protein
VDRRLLVLEEPIKEVGIHEVPLRLTHNVEATLIVEVVGEGVAVAVAVEAKEETPKPRRRAKKEREKEETAPPASADAVEEKPQVEAVDEKPEPETAEEQDPGGEEEG